MKPRTLADHDLNMLVALDALLSLASVTRAAQQTGVSQSAMSHTLNRLREQWGDPLLVRHRGQMTRTALGERLMPEVSAAIALVERLFDARTGFDPATTTRRFVVLSSDYAAAVIIPPLLERLRTSAPGVDLLVRVAREPERELGSRDVSLFIGPPRDETPGLRRQRLFTDRLVVMARASNPLLRGELTLERYLGAQHILVSPRGLRGGFVDDALAKRGLSRRVVLEVPHFLVALLVAATSDLLVTMPSRLAEQAGKLLGIAVKPLPLDLASVEFVLLWHERDHADDAHVWLRREVTAAARGA